MNPGLKAHLGSVRSGTTLFALIIKFNKVPSNIYISNIYLSIYSTKYHFQYKNIIGMIRIDIWYATGLQLRVRKGNLIFLVLNQNICCGYSKEPSEWDGCFEHPKQKLKLTGKKIFTFYSEILVHPNLCANTQAVCTKCNHLYEIFHWAENQMFPNIFMMDNIISTAMHMMPPTI